MGATGKNSKRARPHGAETDTRRPKRRKSPDGTRSRPPDAPKPAGPAPNTLALSTFHKATLAELRPKYDTLVASVISSTKIGTRIERILNHLRRSKTQAVGEGAAGLVPVALLHARPADVCKMITVAEKVKGILAAEDAAVYQYNHLFELPPRPSESTVVEETVLGGEEGEESDDGFEKLEIFDKAANPAEPARPVRSMGIFLAAGPVPELKGKGNVTAQTAGEPRGGD